MDTSTSELLSSHTGSPTFDLSQRDQAAAAQMYSPQESGNSLPPQEVSLARNMETQVISTDDEDSIQLRQKKQSRLRFHPKPQNKAAKDHKKRLRALGYNNFAETGVTYWEPQHMHEIESEHNWRR